MPLGIPHSEFLSWPADDQDKALAWLAEESERCGQCGTRSDEHDPRVGGDPHRYEAVASRCRGCELIAQKRRDLQKDAPDALGVRVGLQLAPEDEDDDDVLTGQER